MRRCESGIRTWRADPGEYHHQSNGQLGGLWRYVGRCLHAVSGRRCAGPLGRQRLAAPTRGRGSATRACGRAPVGRRGSPAAGGRLARRGRRTRGRGPAGDARRRSRVPPWGWAPREARLRSPDGEIVTLPKPPAEPIDGVELHWRKAGAGDAVVLLHPGPGSDDAIFLPWLEPLAATHRVLALDLPDHGSSGDSPPGARSLSGYARAVRGFADVLDLRPYILLGHPSARSSP
jgi:hypothetical protein